MGAPLTIEQIIQNHNIGVNLSDAKTLDGHTFEEFALNGHKHAAEDITSGIMNANRLPTASDTSKGVVFLSSSTDSDSTAMAATPAAVKAVKGLVTGKANATHKHNPADINGGTFTETLVAKNTDDLGVRQIRNIIVGTSNPSSALGSDGDVYLKFE